MRMINGEELEKAFAQFKDTDMISVRTVKTALENSPTITIKDIVEKLPNYLLRALKSELETVNFDNRTEAET